MFPSNYRLISLLHNDYKLFTILAERLKIILQECLHEDESSLLPKRQLRDNLRRTVLKILEYLKNITKNKLHWKQAALGKHVLASCYRTMMESCCRKLMHLQLVLSVPLQVLQCISREPIQVDWYLWFPLNGYQIGWIFFCSVFTQSCHRKPE